MHFFVFSFLFSAFGQALNSFKYQGIVRDNSGNVISNKIVVIQISLLKGSIADTAVYTESHSPTTNQFGLLNLEIGNDNLVFGNFSLIDWSNEPFFIKIEVNGAEMGTNQLLSVPYAKYAEKAGNGFSGNVGWHVPTKTDWELMLSNYGSIYHLGVHLKEVGTLHWLSPNTAADNSSGLTFLPGANRHPEGWYGEFRHAACFQVATEQDVTHNWHFHVLSDEEYGEFSDGILNGFTKGMAYSIRCIKN